MVFGRIASMLEKQKKKILEVLFTILVGRQPSKHIKSIYLIELLSEEETLSHITLKNNNSGMGGIIEFWALKS